MNIYQEKKDFLKNITNLSYIMDSVKTLSIKRNSDDDSNLLSSIYIYIFQVPMLIHITLRNNDSQFRYFLFDIAFVISQYFIFITFNKLSFYVSGILLSVNSRK